ncbi:pentatricopeptide repeat-containing protein at5g44230 [Phtheirospermum japonicum]|uniref:Pentatricopeptide repeat-containing protein at5g44230 n=1 Tax=Phtheirospermum japonicum TaxID=374723 RepID=A0A830C9C5_9LAMI|nr:pentatricopeptide repeat-containing protein at5g44230 [Phtheirospermum japonicum]
MFNESVIVYNTMRNDGITPVTFTYVALLKASATEMNVNLGRQLHGESVKFGGFRVDLFVGNSLLDMYLKCGYLDCGRLVFDEMPERDMISWTSLIGAYAKNTKPREALEYFERMQNAGMKADEVTLVGVINACAQLGVAKFANWVRDVAENSGFSPASNVYLGSALIDMYSKCGCVEDAYEVFKSMREKNVCSYSSMIIGLAIHGRGNLAIELFEEMVRLGVGRNSVTFIGVLGACSHAGFVDQGKSFFEKMESSYGVKRCVDHYNCMVDLLGRTGRLDEALNLVKSMAMEPDAGVWGTLLGACRIHANPDVAEIAAKKLFKLQPLNIGNYILLADVYAKAERWEDVLKVRNLIRKKGLRKSPAFSWIEGAKGEIHEFYAGDTTHPKSGVIMEVLENLIERLKMKGYQPNLSSVLYDVSDE